MIFRIQFHRDGDIKSCEPVESEVRDGGLVMYVEAGGASEAIDLGRKRFDRWRSEKAERLIAEGFCRNCLEVKTVNGSVRCTSCNAKKRRQQAEMRFIEKLPEAERAAALERHQQQKEERRSAHNRRVADRARATLLANSDARWDQGFVPKAHNSQVALRQALRAYDRDPSRFREWLMARIAWAEEVTAADPNRSRSRNQECWSCPAAQR